jgi:hypothetical protein
VLGIVNAVNGKHLAGYHAGDAAVLWSSPARNFSGAIEGTVIVLLDLSSFQEAQFCSIASLLNAIMA